jgi:N-glycosylase/DNA lyase
MPSLLYRGKLALDQMLMGGQSFAWQTLPKGGYLGIIEGRVWSIYQPEKGKIVGEGMSAAQLRRYLALEDPLPSLPARLTYERQAMQSYGGLRLLCQSFDQALISFIVSANNSLGSIRTRLRTLSALIEPELAPGIYGFPTLERIAQAGVPLLRRAGLGYRAEYLYGSARELLSGGLRERIIAAPWPEALPLLRELPGVGPKVADCILVYGLGCRQRYPIDLWIERYCTDELRLRGRHKYEQLQQRLQERWGAHTAQIGQWVFEWKRNVVGKKL